MSCPQSMPPMFPSTIQGISFEVLEHLQIRSWLNAANPVLLTYDYLLTFSDEVEYFWTKKFTLVTLLFYLSRYLPIVDGALTLMPVPVQLCPVIYESAGWLIFMGLGLSQAVLMFATMAICRDHRLVAMCLVLCALGTWVGTGFVIKISMESVIYKPIPFHGFAGCLYEARIRILFIGYLLMTGFETVILFISLYNTLHAQRHASTCISKVLRRDGLIFYIGLTVVSLLNVAILIKAPEELNLVLIEIHRILHGIFSCRILLNLRRAMKEATKRRRQRVVSL